MQTKGHETTSSPDQVFQPAVFAIFRRVGWLPILVVALHEICAHGFNGYERWPSVDIPLHFLGGFAVAFFVSGALGVLVEFGVLQKTEALIHLPLAFTTACVVAVLWEFAEWIVDHVLGKNCQNGVDDTMLDLFMGMLGAAAFAIPVAIKRLRAEATWPLTPE